jgi:hypothetical protein
VPLSAAAIRFVKRRDKPNKLHERMPALVPSHLKILKALRTIAQITLPAG